MKRMTVVSSEGSEPSRASEAHEGSLKLFFSYAPFTGTTSALLDELQGMVGRGKDVFLAELVVPSTGATVGMPFDVDQVLKRKPDLVALDDFAAANPPGSRNRYRYQDALELLHAGIDVYAPLRVSNLESERDRVKAITGQTPSLLVPDRMFYNAQQVEFVDMDPTLLAERSKAAGRAQVDIDALRQLRLLAMRCVSYYVASSSSAARSETGGPGPARFDGVHDRMVALVTPGEPPNEVLHEAQRLADMRRAPLQALCVRHARRGASQADDPELDRLSEQVGALGYDLVTLTGEDIYEVLRDYLRVQGIQDVVLTSSMYARLQPAGAFQRRRQAGEAIGGVRTHIIPGAAAPDSRGREFSRGVRSVLEFKPSDLLVALLAVAASIGVAMLFYLFGFGEVAYLVYFLAATLVAAYTRSYLPSILTLVLCCVLEATVVLPRFSVALGTTGVISYAIMVASLSIVTVIAVGMGRSAESAGIRERHTQAIYELGRLLSSTHGLIEVVDVSLDALTRLFSRSVAFYVSDPFERPSVGGRNRRLPTTRTVPGDIDAEEFERINECNIAHWVFVNDQPAGAGTDTNSASRILYLPLEMDGSVIGVVAISELRPLSAGEREFLDLVIDQILAAFERRAMAASHASDLRAMRVSNIRNVFIGGLVESVSQSAETVSSISRMIQTAKTDDTQYKEALEEVADMESRRTRIMTDRLRADLDERDDSGSKCDVRAEVTSVVETSRQGLGSTVIELEPSEEVSAITADAVMVREATALVLEASLSCAPVGGCVSVGVHGHPGFVTVSVSDDRPDALTTPVAAFSHDYDAQRSHRLLALLADHDLIVGDTDSSRALAEALGVPTAACVIDGRADIRRIARIDRTQYGLYIAALIVRAHNGEIKMRHRLGGGSVTTFSLPMG